MMNIIGNVAAPVGVVASGVVVGLAVGAALPNSERIDWTPRTIGIVGAGTGIGALAGGFLGVSLGGGLRGGVVGALAGAAFAASSAFAANQLAG